MKLKSDLHLHTCEDRFDRVAHSAQKLIAIAAQKGFKVLSITNHDTLTWNRDLQSYAADLDILLIPGLEKTIEEKHVLILNANRLATEKIQTFDDLRRAKQDGMCIIAPHPFFKKRCCLEERLLEYAALFDAVEFTFFYSKWLNFNQKAVRVAKEKGLPVVGNSDCHVLKYQGICHSIIHTENQTIEAVFSAIRKHNVEVVSRPIFLPKLAMMYLEMTIRLNGKNFEDQAQVSGLWKKEVREQPSL